MADLRLRRNLNAVFDPGEDFPPETLLMRTFAMLDAAPKPVRRGTRPLGVVALVGIFLLAAFGLLELHVWYSQRSIPARQGQTSRSLGSWAFGDTGMVTPSIGWNRSSGFLTRTTDGGAHWSDVAPPGLGNSFQAYYLDATHAWITHLLGSNLITLRTADGGITWQQGSPILAAYPNGGDPRLYFVDAAHGWLLLLAAPSSNAATYADLVYRTNDGGAQWQLAATNRAPRDWSPAPSTYCYRWCSLSFASASTGWLTDCCWSDQPHLHILVSHDGGVTWNPQIAPATSSKLSCPCSVEGPFAFDDRDAMVLIRSSQPYPGFASRSALLVTSDAGNVWTIRSLPGEAQMTVSFRDVKHGWAIAGSSPLFAALRALEKAGGPLPLYRTDDGGITWVPVATNLLLVSTDGLEFRGLGFLDGRSGFAIRSRLGPTTQLLRTIDGGHTWTVAGTQP